MLYVTTRSNAEPCTAQRALRENRGADGGLYVPFRPLRFSREEIEALPGKSFNSNVAEVLNRLFGVGLTGYDVDFCIGRRSVRLEKLGQRVMLGECWHNLESDHSRTVRNLTALLTGDKEAAPGDWAHVGIRIAVLFGIFGELMRGGMAGPAKRVDVSLVSGDFAWPMSAWYARQWGLSIGNIVCCCNENGNLWDLCCHGQLRTDGVAVKTNTPEADIVVPAGLERLIYAVGGVKEVEKYLAAVRRGGSYFAEEHTLAQLRKGLYATVNSQRRVLDTIPSVYGTHGILLSPYAALAYAGLQDHRARTGESRLALVLEEKSPEKDLDTVAGALGITAAELKSHLDRN
ncbi:MAG: hypothetical protein IJ001_06710 [Oscillospiraceae bacterium]|nr:hypothetical protein [Oscillospiraceae bacterium]